MQSIPFGSSVLYTKQLNAALNGSPQGPCAMPPRQGQSQLISPVSSLKAPSCEACSSVSSKAPGSAIAICGDTSDGEVCCCLDPLESESESSVGIAASSGAGWARDGETLCGQCQCADMANIGELGQHTRWFFGEDIAGVVIV